MVEKRAFRELPQQAYLSHLHKEDNIFSLRLLKKFQMKAMDLKPLYSKEKFGIGKISKSGFLYGCVATNKSQAPTTP